MTNRDQIDSIVSRHHADATESNRTCRACGLPWPCDVQKIWSAFRAQRTTSTLRERRARTPRRAAPVPVWVTAGDRRAAAGDRRRQPLTTDD